MDETQKPLTISDAVVFTGYSKAYLYKLSHQGILPCFKPTGGRLFFKREDLEKFIFQGRRGSIAS